MAGRLPARRHSLRVEVTCQTRRPIRAVGLASWLERVAPARVRGEVSVALVSDARIRTLNRTYRGVDRATDVLSFPAGDVVPAPGGAPGVRRAPAGPPTPVRLERQLIGLPVLGDIAIAVGVASRQAAAAGHPLASELRVLALHGLLHLAGHDHEQDRGEMAELEARLRKRGGLPTGLIERAAPASARKARRS